MRDYLAILQVEAKDVLQYGVRGMKWGVRRTDAQLKAAPKAEAAKKANAEPAKEVFGAASGESSSARYDRLIAESKANGASSLSDTDLKFVNARTQAVASVAKLTQENPNWLKETGTKVLKTTAQNQLQGLSDSLAKKYIGDRIADKLKEAAPSIEDTITSKAAAAARNRQIDRGVKEILDLSSQSPVGRP